MTAVYPLPNRTLQPSNRVAAAWRSSRTGTTPTSQPGGDGSTRPRFIDALKPLLVIHNATEENDVYPAIHSIAQRPQHANGLYHQQDAAEIAFFDLGMLDPGDPDFVRKAAELRDALQAHVREEEDKEFPALRESMTPAAMAKLTADVREFRATFGGPAFR